MGCQLTEVSRAVKISFGVFACVPEIREPLPKRVEGTTDIRGDIYLEEVDFWIAVSQFLVDPDT